MTRKQRRQKAWGEMRAAQLWVVSCQDRLAGMTQDDPQLDAAIAAFTKAIDERRCAERRWAAAV